MNHDGEWTAEEHNTLGVCASRDRGGARHRVAVDQIDGMAPRRYGVTRILQCRSGSATSSNAAADGGHRVGETEQRATGHGEDVDDGGPLGVAAQHELGIRAGRGGVLHEPAGVVGAVGGAQDVIRCRIVDAKAATDFPLS